MSDVSGLHEYRHLLKTNQRIAAFSLDGKAGLCLRTRASVVPSMTTHPAAKMPNRVVTDHLLAKYPTMLASIG